jgi:RNA polymerase sigma-70 factor (ECF subfamily)
VVGRWCERAGLRYPDTGDVIQEVFRTVAQRVGDFRRDRGSGSFVAFLWTVTRSRIVDHHRRSGREPEAVGGSDFQERLHQEPAPEDSSSEATPVEEQNVVIRRVLDLVRGQVAETTWEAFWRTVIDGQSPADVAAELGLSSAAAVYVACSRVKKRLRQQLEGLLD